MFPPPQLKRTNKSLTIIVCDYERDRQGLDARLYAINCAVGPLAWMPMPSVRRFFPTNMGPAGNTAAKGLAFPSKQSFRAPQGFPASKKDPGGRCRLGPFSPAAYALLTFGRSLRKTGFCRLPPARRGNAKAVKMCHFLKKPFSFFITGV